MMHPYLVGFWTTAGPAGLALFALFFLRDGRRVDWAATDTVTFVPIFMYALPVLAMAYVVYRTRQQVRPDSSHRKRKRMFVGGLTGMMLILGLLFLFLDTALSPPPELPKAPMIEHLNTTPAP